MIPTFAFVRRPRVCLVSYRRAVVTWRPQYIIGFVNTFSPPGYKSAWFSKILGRDVCVTAARVLANTTRIKVGSGIVQIYGRDAVATA